MRKLLFGAILFFQASGYAHAASPSTESPETFIQRLYKVYMVDYVKNVYWFDNPEKLIPYFEPALIDLFMRDEACKEATKGICASDSDPIINAQDYDEKHPYRLTVRQVGKKPVKLKVLFSDGMKHFGGDTRTIYYTLKKAGTGWLVSDISYSGRPSLAKELAGYKPDFDTIDDFIHFMEKTNKSEEYQKARTVQCESKMCFVLFTLEEGMNYHQHLAVLQSADNSYAFVDDMVVGGRGVRGIDSVRIANGKVMLETKEYGPRDPMCCPSMPRKMVVSVMEAEGTLVTYVTY